MASERRPRTEPAAGDGLAEPAIPSERSRRTDPAVAEERAAVAMVDLRWHTASLVAVFLALGIGVLVGGAAVVGGPLRTRQRAAVRQVEAQVAALGQERTQLDRTRAFAAEALPWLVAGRLAGGRVTVVSLGQPGAADQLRSTLGLAGAQTETLLVPAGLAPATASGWAVYGPGPRVQQWRRAAAELARAVWSGGGLADLEGSGSVLAGGSLQPAGAVVLLVGPGSDPRVAADVARSLIAARPGAAAIVGAVASEAAPLVAVFTGLRLSVVDDVELAAGQAAVVLALAGFGGHFGVLPGATGLLPAWQPN